MEKSAAIRTLLTEQPRLLAYIRTMVVDPALTDEVFQEVAVLLLDKYEGLGDDPHLRGWLMITAKNLSLKAIRDRARRPMALDEQTLEAMDTHWQHLDRDALDDRLESLRICLAHLTDYARRILQLRYRNGLMGDELAAALNRKKQTVYTALTRIHKALAECIEHREQAVFRRSPTQG